MLAARGGEGLRERNVIGRSEKQGKVEEKIGWKEISTQFEALRTSRSWGSTTRQARLFLTSSLIFYI